MLALLKAKSKMTLEQKPRTKYDALLPSKRMKPDPAASQPMKDIEEAKQPLNEKDKRKKKIAPHLLEKYEKEQE